jgi:hypothetical protein
VLVPTAALAALADQVLEGYVGNGHIAFTILAVAAVAIAGLGYYFLKGVLAHIVVSHREGEAPPGLAAIAPRLPYATMIACDLMLSAGFAIGIELFIIPGLLFGTYYGLAPIVVEVERRGPIDSMRRSRDLVRGNFWAVAAILAFTLGAVAVLSLPLKALAGVIFPGGSGDPFEEGLGLLLAGILVKPIGAVASIELTLDLIAAREPGE